MIRIVEIWNKGTLESTHTEESPEDATLRAAIDTAISELQTIQSAALTTEASQISAIKKNSDILEKAIKYIKRTL